MSKNAVENTITLRSSDGDEFIMTEAETKVSKTISRMIEDDCAQSTIPLPNVTTKILTKVMEYCKMHISNKEGDDLHTASSEAPTAKDVEKWDTEFLKVDQGTLFDLLLAANYLEIQGLLKLICQNVADQMKGKTPEELRKHFLIINDYTAVEEEEVRQQNCWAFD